MSDKPVNNKDIGKALEELNQLYQMLKGEGVVRKRTGKKKSDKEKSDSTKEDSKISFNSVLFLLTKGGEKKKVSLSISFVNGKVGFRVSNSTLRQFKQEDTKTVLTATIPNPEFTDYILSQKPAIMKMVLRDIALTAFLSHDIKKSLNQSPLTSKEWEKISSYLDPPKIRFPKVGVMFGVREGFPAWGTVLHSIGQNTPKNRYITIFIQKSPSSVPNVVFMNQYISSNVHHRYSTREPCIMHPNKWYEGSTIYTAIGRTIAWITAYEYWKQTGVWPGE